MQTKILNEKTKKILSCIEFYADQTTPWYAKQTKLKEHSINYYIGLLKNNGVILNRCPFINTYQLGYIAFTMFFSLISERESDHEKFMRQILKHHLVSWAGRLGGEFNYGVSFCAQDSSDVRNFFDSLSKEFGSIIRSKAISVRTAAYCFGRKHLWPEYNNRKILYYQKVGETVQLTDVDKKILSYASNKTYSSNRELAQIADIPFSTLERRIKNLQKKNIIVGYSYLYSLNSLGFYQYRLLVNTHGINTEVRDKLFAFCRDHPNILLFIECISDWDYEIGIEVPDYDSLNQIIQAIYQEFSKEIGHIKNFPVVRVLKFASYPEYQEQNK